MNSAEMKERAEKVLMKTYGRYDLAIAKGEGVKVYDPEGNEYLDFIGGIAVCSLGHSHPGVAEAVAKQAKVLVHTSNLFYTEPQVRLAEVLVENSFADRVFFCNSGAEANEGAIKLARKYSHDKYGPGRYRIITLKDSFHGRTMVTLTATGQEKLQKGFEPLMNGFSYVPLNDLDALKGALGDDVCAVMLEPIQGEGGVNDAGETYLKDVVELCREKDVLVIFDEVQVGMGRTGKLFAYEHFGIEPDIMTLAKALANGIPMGALLARESVAQAFGPGTHGSTFGGTPLVSAAALVVLETILAPGFLEDVTKTGDYFKTRLMELVDKYDFVVRVKGRGLILGLETGFSRCRGPERIAGQRRSGQYHQGQRGAVHTAFGGNPRGNRSNAADSGRSDHESGQGKRCIMKRDFLSLNDLRTNEVEMLIKRAVELKAGRKDGLGNGVLAGKTLGMLFNKPSMRTRVSFEVGVVEFGGHVVVLSDQEVGLGKTGAHSPCRPRHVAVFGWSDHSDLCPGRPGGNGSKRRYSGHQRLDRRISPLSASGGFADGV